MTIPIRTDNLDQLTWDLFARIWVKRMEPQFTGKNGDNFYWWRECRSAALDFVSQELEQRERKEKAKR